MINTENLMEIQLSLSSPTYRGPKGDKPVKGVDYFTQEDINDIVSQIETKDIDLDGYATKDYVDEAVSGVVVSETDPTVPGWAKQPNKPTYTASEVGALPADTQLFSGNYEDLSNKPTIPTVPSNVSAFTNDAGYLTSHQSLTDYATKAYVDDAIADIPAGGITVETDPTVPSWAKQATKPTYTANEVGALPADTVLFSGSYNDLTDKPTIPEVPANVSAFTNDAGYLTSHQSLTDYATKSYVETAIRGAESGLLKRSVVQALPVSDIDEDTIYMVAKTGSTGDVYDEYLYVNSNWEHIGSTDVDLTGYATETYVDTAIGNIDISPAPIVIQTTIAGQPSVVDGVYTLPLTITSNNMAEAYAQYQTHPSTVGMAVDLTALGRATKMYLDCESFYRYDDGNGGYTYETYGEFNDNSLSQSFGYEFMNVNIHLDTGELGSKGTLAGLSTVNQLASKANSADLATVATSGDYNDLTNKPTIPTAYTLPTATTSTLGGVKVDGTTITITDGVISATSSGGSSYTFINGLTENNGTVSWDLYSRIHSGLGINSLRLNTANNADGDQSLAEGFHTSANGAYSHAEGNYTQASGSSQHAEGKFNVEDSNSILQNIAGNGSSSSARATMFARDWNGNEYLSGNLFVGCNDFTTTANGLTTANAGGGKVATESYVATAIANIPSGGSSYTAGNGIEIDSNGVISANIRDNTSALWMALLGISKDWTYFSFNAKSFYSSNTVEEFFDALKRGYIVYIGQSVYWNGLGTLLYNAGIRGFFTLKKDGTYTYDTINSNQPNWRPTYRYDYWLCGNILMATSHSAYNDLFGEGLTKSIYYDNTTSGLSASTIKGAIDEVASNLNTRIPSAPTTDGNYVLKVSVSSGTPTYSWVAE